MYDFAQSTEESGVRFYREMAECTRTDGFKRIFRMLAQDEELLLKRLQKMSRPYPQMNTMECSYLDKDAIIFNNMRNDSLCRLIASDLDAYEIARNAEREVPAVYACGGGRAGSGYEKNAAADCRNGTA